MKIKNKIFFLLAFLSAISSYGQKHPNKDIIEEVVYSFLSNKSKNAKIQTIKEIEYKGINVAYIAQLNEKGWVLCSYTFNAKPILAFNLSDKFETEKPPAVQSFINNYYEQLYIIIKNKIENKKYQKEWSELLNRKKHYKNEYSGFSLLNLPKGYVRWGQSKNNTGTCHPAYNELAPPKNQAFNACASYSPNSCYCDNKPIGCGAVAMGQIMWYWEWPDDYDWGIIPTALYESTPQNEVDELNRLLFDCAEGMNMHYCCEGSWATMNKIVDALHQKNYSSATKVVRKYWSDEAWKKLMKTELDVGRPILYRGGEVIDLGSVSDWGNVHYFVCDGYDENDLFHFNWGWGNRNVSDINSGFSIDNLVPEGNDYSNQQKMIIGISPHCNITPYNITDVSYTLVNSNKTEKAINDIILPKNGKTLTVEPNARYVLKAGHKIELKPGFRAKKGSYFHAEIKSNNDCNCGGDINVNGWTNVITPNGDGANDQLCYYVYNANSYMIEIFDRDGNTIYQGAGTINGNPVCVWAGTGLNQNCIYAVTDDRITFTYLIAISFFNNCGRKLSKNYIGYAILNNNSKIFSDTVISKDYQVDKPILYPNPTSGTIYIENWEGFNKIIYVYDVSGRKITEFINQNKIDLSFLKNGVYFIRLVSSNTVNTFKILIK